MSDPSVFDATTPRLRLPTLFPGQAQKELFVNEALSILDGLVHQSVEGVADTPPPSPAQGESWIIGETASGAWAGHEGKLALFIAGSWTIIDAVLGMNIYDKSVSKMQHFDGTWQTADEPTDPQGGTVIDIEARAAIQQLVTGLRNLGILSGS